MIKDFIATDRGSALALRRNSSNYLMAQLDSHVCTAKTAPLYVPDVVIHRDHAIAPLTYRNIQQFAYMGKLLDLRVMEMAGYDWPGPYDEPFDHQRATSSMICVHPRSFILNEMGTGKTASVLWAIDFGIKRGKLKRVLIICPKRCVRDVWETQGKEIFPLARFGILTGARKRRLKELERGYTINIINHDAMRTYADELRQVKWDLIVIDEATAFKNAKAARSKNMLALATSVPRLWQLSGSIMPQAPTDVWHPAKMGNPTTCPPYRKFETQVMNIHRIETADGKSFPKARPKPGANKIAYRLLQPAIRFRKEDCIDLPQLTEDFIETELSKDQEKALRALVEENKTRLESGEQVDFAEVKAFAIKALQIMAGCVYGPKGRIRLGAPDRLRTCKDLIEQSLSKTLIFTAFQETGDYLSDELKEFNPCRLDGTISEKVGVEMTRRFIEDESSRVYLLHPKSAGHGLNLQVASTAIYYSPTHDAEVYTQSRERMARPGQQHKMTLYHLYSNPQEKAVYMATANKLKEQDAMLDLYKNFIGDI